jgi:hypothetical protein
MKTILLSILLLFTINCFSQYKPDTLFDKSTFTKYILDSSNVHVIATDSNGKQLWFTDLWRNLISQGWGGFHIKRFYLKDTGIYFETLKCEGIIEKENGKLSKWQCN